MTESPFEMTISLNVLNHLGIGLYSSTPAVLSELVANAWDADARQVEIEVQPEEGRVVVKDNGHGMTESDVNEKYLRVGYQKRESDGAVTDLGRHVMGRKGIGKLSVFSIARVAEIHTVHEGQKIGFRMDRDDIKALIESGATAVYRPVPVPQDEIDIESGTRIALTKLNKAISQTERHLRTRLARRFSVIGLRDDFQVLVGGTAISPDDRSYYSKLQFAWYFDDDEHLTRNNASPARLFKVDGKVGTLPADSKSKKPAIDLHVRGWIGTVDRPDNIEEANNAIVLLAHGKLVHENLLAVFGEAGVYADYVMGEIHADFLDLDELEDIVTSGRQSVKESDERVKLLTDFIGAQVREIKKRWTELRRKVGAKRALENPVLKEWYSKLGHDQRRFASSMFGKIESLRVIDGDTKREIYKSSMLAFEKMAQNEALSKLDALESEGHFEALTSLFGTVDDLEAAHYYHIIRSRLSVLEKFRELTPDAKEKVLQQYLFDHIWLLDASWERAASKPHIEEAVKTEFASVTARLSDEERKGRVDLRYKTAAGKHIIIELKKYSVRVDVNDLSRQVRKYRRALEKCLRERFPNESANIESICVLGGSPTPRDDPEYVRKTLDAADARWYTYDQLIDDAMANYGEYLSRQTQISELVRLIDRLDGEEF